MSFAIETIADNLNGHLLRPLLESTGLMQWNHSILMWLPLQADAGWHPAQCPLIFTLI